MKNYKQLLNESQASIDATKALLASVKESAKRAKDPGIYLATNKKDLLGKLETDLKNNFIERHMAAMQGLSEAKGKQDLLNKSQREKLLPSEKLFHGERAARLLNRGSVQDAINIYKRLVSGLDKNGSMYRYLYDDELSERLHFESPAEIVLADEAIDRFRSDSEREAIEAVRESEALFHHHKLANGFIEQQLVDLKETGDCVDYEWDQIFEQMQQNAKGRKPETVGPETVSAIDNAKNILQSNPYDESGE